MTTGDDADSKEEKQEAVKTQNTDKEHNLNPEFGRPSLITKDTLQDILSNLISINNERLRNANELQGVFVPPKVVDFLFAICTQLEVPNEVKYTAFYILDEFMCRHVGECYDTVKLSQTNNNTAGPPTAKRSRWTYSGSDWTETEAKISSQFILRLLSSIQISSKLFSFHCSLTNKRIHSFLLNLGHCFTERAILQSELRILADLEYRVNFTTPLDYTETLLSSLCMTGRIRTSQMEAYWCCATLALDAVYLQGDGVYIRLLSHIYDKTRSPSTYRLLNTTRNTNATATDVNIQELATVKADYLLLSSAVISVGCCCIEGVASAEELASHLSVLTSVPAQDIRDFTAVLLRLAMSD